MDDSVSPGRRRLTLGEGFGILCMAWIGLLPVGNNEILFWVFASLGLLAGTSVLSRRRAISGRVLWITLPAVTLMCLGFVTGAGNLALYNALYVYALVPAFWWICGIAFGTHLIRPLLYTLAVVSRKSVV